MMRQSGFNPEDNICWQFGNKGDRAWRCQCPACNDKLQYGERVLVHFGRCRSGQRWFWSAATYDDTGRKATGLVATEDEATEAAMATIRGFRDGRPILAIVRHGWASHELKKINEAKRQARPAPDTTDSRVIEYLYSADRDDYDGSLILYRFIITKKTAKRIFYLRWPERCDEHGELLRPGSTRSPASEGTGFVDRMKLEADGNVYNRGQHWSSRDYHLYATAEAALEVFRRNDPKPVDPTNLAALKEAMANAHPDKGGSSAAFIEARAKYVAARRMARGAA